MKIPGANFGANFGKNFGRSFGRACLEFRAKFRVIFWGRFRNKFREKQKQTRNVAKEPNGRGGACRLNSRRRNPSESTDCQELHCPNLSNLGFVSLEGWILAMYTENLVGFPSPFRQCVRVADACRRNFCGRRLRPLCLQCCLTNWMTAALCPVWSSENVSRFFFGGGGRDEHSLEAWSIA